MPMKRGLTPAVPLATMRAIGFNRKRFMLEAFASGLPVVSTEAGGVPAILRHGKDGLLAPVGDADAIAAHVLHLLECPDRARALAESALRTLEAYTWPHVRSQWLSLYRSLLPSQAQQRAAVQA